MKAKYLRRISKWKSLNIIDVFLHSLEHYNVVSLVECKGRLEHILIEPQLQEKGKE